VRGLKPPGYQAPFSCGSGGVNGPPPHRAALVDWAVLGAVLSGARHDGGEQRVGHTRLVAESEPPGLEQRLRVGLVALFALFCSQHTVQLMSAGMIQSDNRE
jgi:hypothetical protein